MSLVNDIVVLVETLPEFYTPIGTPLSPEIRARLGYNQNFQGVLVPHLFWTGPFAHDPGQAARGISGTQKEMWWFNFVHSSMSSAVAWCDSARSAIQTYFDANPKLDCTINRITSAIYIPSGPQQTDQIQRGSQEFGPYQAVIGYTFGYQTLSG